MPIVGPVFAIPGLICGIVVMKQRSRNGSYSAVSSNVHAIIGLVVISLGILVSVAFLILVLVAGK